VWVLPEGYEGLTQLALAILDVATADPAPSVVEHYDVNQDKDGYKYRVQRYVCRVADPCSDVEVGQSLNEAKAKILALPQYARSLPAVKTEAARNEMQVAMTSTARDALAHLKKAKGHLPEDDQRKLDRVMRGLEMIQEQGVAAPDVLNVTTQAARDVGQVSAPVASPGPPGRINYFQPYQGQGLQVVPSR
jgi:hypothetical protein